MKIRLIWCKRYIGFSCRKNIGFHYKYNKFAYISINIGWINVWIDYYKRSKAMISHNSIIHDYYKPIDDYIAELPVKVRLKATYLLGCEIFEILSISKEGDNNYWKIEYKAKLDDGIFILKVEV